MHSLDCRTARMPFERSGLLSTESREFRLKQRSCIAPRHCVDNSGLPEDGPSTPPGLVWRVRTCHSLGLLDDLPEQLLQLRPCLLQHLLALLCRPVIPSSLAVDHFIGAREIA